MDRLLHDIQERSSYAKYDKWGLYNWGMLDTIRSSIPNEFIFDYYEWRTKIRQVIIYIKFGMHRENYWT